MKGRRKFSASFQQVFSKSAANFFKNFKTRNREYWDNWQGWHKPNIYKAHDVQVIISRGRITTPDGWEVIVPKPDAVPVC